MLHREELKHCVRCDEATLHSRRLVAVPLLVALVAVVAAGSCFLLGAELSALGVLLLWAALYLVCRDREMFARIGCQRCRGELRAQARGTKPTGRSETSVF